jgi:hypothetical protein
MEFLSSIFSKCLDCCFDSGTTDMQHTYLQPGRRGQPLPVHGTHNAATQTSFRSGSNQSSIRSFRAASVSQQSVVESLHEPVFIHDNKRVRPVHSLPGRTILPECVLYDKYPTARQSGQAHLGRDRFYDGSLSRNRNISSGRVHLKDIMFDDISTAGAGGSRWGPYDNTFFR